MRVYEAQFDPERETVTLVATAVPGPGRYAVTVPAATLAEADAAARAFEEMYDKIEEENG